MSLDPYINLFQIIIDIDIRYQKSVNLISNRDCLYNPVYKPEITGMKFHLLTESHRIHDFKKRVIGHGKDSKNRERFSKRGFQILAWFSKIVNGHSLSFAFILNRHKSLHPIHLCQLVQRSHHNLLSCIDLWRPVQRGYHKSIGGNH